MKYSMPDDRRETFETLTKNRWGCELSVSTNELTGSKTWRAELSCDGEPLFPPMLRHELTDLGRMLAEGKDRRWLPDWLRHCPPAPADKDVADLRDLVAAAEARLTRLVEGRPVTRTADSQPAPAGGGERKMYTVSVCRTSTGIIDVWATSEEQAEELADDLYDWDSLQDERCETTALAWGREHRPGVDAARAEARPPHEDVALCACVACGHGVTVVERRWPSREKEYLALVFGPHFSKPVVADVETLREWGFRDFDAFLTGREARCEAYRARRKPDPPRTEEENRLWDRAHLWETAAQSLKDLKEGRDHEGALKDLRDLHEPTPEPPAQAPAPDDLKVEGREVTALDPGGLDPALGREEGGPEIER